MLSAPPSHHPALQSHNWSKWLTLETLKKRASQWILDVGTFSAHELSCPLVDMFDLFSLFTQASIKKTISSSIHSYRKYTWMPRQFRFIDSILVSFQLTIMHNMNESLRSSGIQLVPVTPQPSRRPPLGQVTIFQSCCKSPVRWTDLQHACTVVVLQRCQGMIRREDLLTPSDHLATLKSASCECSKCCGYSSFCKFWNVFLQKPKRMTMNLSKSAAPWAPGCLYFQPRQQNRKRSLAGWNPETRKQVSAFRTGPWGMTVWGYVLVIYLVT